MKKLTIIPPGKNSDLIREANGKTYVNAKYNPELNSKFSYKIIAETSSSDKKSRD